MARSGGVLSRNPNMCASCSSIADGSQEVLPTTFATVSGVEASALADPADAHKPDELLEPAELVKTTAG